MGLLSSGEPVTLFAMSETEIILASASPRRLQYLRWARYQVTVVPVLIDETPADGETAAELVTRLARAKATSISTPGVPVVAGDTVVSCRDKILGKPANPQVAREMLAALSGADHEVISGWCVRHGDELLEGVEVSQVRFRELSSDQIDRYVDSGEPLDKAGAYGIQGIGRELVEAVRGSWSNVVGLPVVPVLAALRDLMVR